MASNIMDIRDQKFVLNEQLKVAEELPQYSYFGDYDQETLDTMLEAALDLAEKEIFPTLVDADKEGIHFDNGEVKVPASYHKIYQIFRENGWINAQDKPEVGGMGLPHAVYIAANETFMAANGSFSLYPVLTHGAAKIIEEYGSAEQQARYMEKLYTGEWAGTMCLTEPGAGSDLGNLRAKAIPVDEAKGLYKIEGEKIFITGGEQDMTPNIVHTVLARIEGAPAGHKGISVFLVPKYRVDEQGNLGERNGVHASGVEHKMGIKSSATCSLVFGEQGDAYGELLGEPGKGLSPIMFTMMNEERLNIGIQALGMASTGYMHAVKFAKDRPQGSHPLKEKRDPNVRQVPIVNQPDVRRMLFRMKSYLEGMRALAYWTGLAMDRVKADIDKERWQGLVELMTPIIKAYLSDRGFDINVEAIQVHGGYGYTQEYPVEQLARDNKITSIYEGTNGIQALDLLGRKLTRNNGELVNLLMEEMKSVLEDPRAKEWFGPCQEQVAGIAAQFKKMAFTIVPKIATEPLSTMGAAVPILEIMGDMLLGWMWLWQMVTAQEKINEGSQEAYYKGKVVTGKFYIKNLLPATEGKMNGLLNGETSIFDIEDGVLASEYEAM